MPRRLHTKGRGQAWLVLFCPVVLSSLFFLPPSDASAACSSESKKAKVFGTKSNNSFTGSTGRSYYGLNGNDTFRARSGSDCMTFIGGRGNDVYIPARSSITTIYDTSGTDTINARGLIYANSANTYSAEYLNKHLIVADLNTGSVIVVADWKSRKIEKVISGEGIKFTHSGLRARILRSPNHLGNLSRSTLISGGIWVPSSSAASKDLAYVAAKEKAIAKRQLKANSSPNASKHGAFILTATPDSPTLGVPPLNYARLLRDIAANDAQVLGYQATLVDSESLKIFAQQTSEYGNLLPSKQFFPTTSLGLYYALPARLESVTELGTRALRSASVATEFRGFHPAIIGNQELESIFFSIDVRKTFKNLYLSSFYKAEQFDNPVKETLLFEGLGKVRSETYGLRVNLDLQEIGSVSAGVSVPARITQGGIRNKIPVLFGGSPQEITMKTPTNRFYDVAWSRSYSKELTYSLAARFSDDSYGASVTRQVQAQVTLAF